MLKCGGWFHSAGAAFCEILSFFSAVRLGWAFRVFGVLDVAVTLGFAFQAVASELCFHDKFQLKNDFGGWECAQDVSKSFQKVWCKFC